MRAIRNSLRKLMLTAHVSSSVGWLGAIVVYLYLATSSLTSDTSRAALTGYVLLHQVASSVIVPFSLAALVSGVVQSLSTPWGLFRHYWILAKFLLTVVATTVLLLHSSTIERMSGTASEMPLSAVDFEALRVQLVVHATGGLIVLLVATALSVYKPWGRTPYGRRA